MFQVSTEMFSTSLALYLFSMYGREENAALCSPRIVFVDSLFFCHPRSGTYVNDSYFTCICICMYMG